MPAPSLHSPRTLLTRLAAVAAGIAVPMSQIGIGVITTVLAVACAAIAFRGGLGDRLRDVLRAVRSPVGVAVVLTFILWLPSLPGSIDPAKSVEVWLRMIAYLGLGALLWSFLRADAAIHALTVKALILASLVTAILAMVNSAGMEELIQAIRFKGWRSGEPTLTMKHYASAAACLVPVLLLACARAAGRWRAMAGISAVGLVAFIFLTHSGSAKLGLGAGGALALLALLLHGRRRWMTAGLGAGLAALLLGTAWFSTQQIAAERELESFPLPAQIVDTHRQSVWQFALHKYAEAPWLGHGIDAINKVEGSDTVVRNARRYPGGDVGYVEQELMPSHPHNWLIEVLAETGPVGLAGLLGAVITLFSSIFSTAAERWPDPVVLARTGLFGAYFGSSLANFSFWASWWQIVFIALWAILAADPVAERTSFDRAPAGKGRPPESARGR